MISAQIALRSMNFEEIKLKWKPKKIAVWEKHKLTWIQGRNRQCCKHCRLELPSVIAISNTIIKDKQMYAIKTILRLRQCRALWFLLLTSTLFTISVQNVSGNPSSRLAGKPILTTNHPITNTNKFASVLSLAQGQLSGRVTDSLNRPISGVSIRVVGAAHEAQTNDDGLYIIQAQPGQTLEFSAVGYVKQSVVLANVSVLNMVLKT